MIRTVIVGVLVLAAAAVADDDAQRSKLTGSWQAETAGAKKDASSYVLQRSDDGMRVLGSNGAKTLVEFDCKFAQECAIKDSGRNAKITIYFNGPKLVENETIGSRVVRKRYSATGDGNTMEEEIIPIEPEGKAETIVFKRVSSEAAKQ